MRKVIDFIETIFWAAALLLLVGLSISIIYSVIIKMLS